MISYVISQLQRVMQAARQTYGVDPVIFLILYLGCAPFWYYSIFRTLRAAASRSMNEAMLWSAVFLGATIAPFVYVILFGRNIPWWVYLLIAILVAQGIVSLVTKLKRPPAASV